MSSAQTVASASTKLLLHDVSKATPACYSSGTSGGTGLQPLPVFSSMKNYGANKINSVAWSHNNQIIAQGFDDGIIQLSAANSGKKVHQISTNVASSLSN